MRYTTGWFNGIDSFFFGMEGVAFVTDVTLLVCELVGICRYVVLAMGMGVVVGGMGGSATE